MRSLPLQQILSLQLLLLLRICQQRCLHSNLHSLWVADPFKVDHVLELAISVLLCPSQVTQWTLHTILNVDWWRLKFFALFQHHYLLRQQWQRYLHHIGGSHRLKVQATAAIHVFWSRLLPGYHAAFSQPWNDTEFRSTLPWTHEDVERSLQVEHDIHEERAADCEMQFLASQPILPDYEMETLQDDIVQDSGSWTEADVDASLRVEQDIHEERAAHSQMQFSDAVPDIGKVSPPRRKRTRPEKVEVSPRTEALVFEHSRNDRGRISPLHEADSPRHRKYKLWYQNEVWVSSSAEETEEDGHAASSVLETRVQKKQFKFGQCPDCGRALHAAVPETGSLAGCYVLRCNGFKKWDASCRRTCWFVKRFDGDLDQFPSFLKWKRSKMLGNLKWQFSNSR